MRLDNTRIKCFKRKMLCRLWVGEEEGRNGTYKKKPLFEVGTAVMFSFGIGCYLWGKNGEWEDVLMF